MNIELEWTEDLKTLDFNSKYGDSDTYRFESKAETKGDSNSRVFSVVGSLTREKGQNDGGSGENFEGAQMFVSRLIQQYIYPSFSYDQFNWNIMLSFPWTSTDFDLTFQNNLVGADQYNISIIKDKELALKANLLTATIPSFEVESSYIVPIVKQLMALFSFSSTPTSTAPKPKRRRFRPKKPFIGEPLSPLKIKYNQENGFVGTIGKDSFRIKTPTVAVQENSKGLLNVSNVLSIEDRSGKASNPFNFTIERQKESTELKIDFVSGNQMIQELNMRLKETGVDVDLLFSGNWDGGKTVLRQKFTLGDGILKRGNIRDLFESYLASKGTLELSLVENLCWDCVLGFGGHSRESRTAKLSCDVNKNKLSLELFENHEIKASFYDDKTRNLIVI